jgi:hypothetical protein
VAVVYSWANPCVSILSVTGFLFEGDETLGRERKTMYTKKIGDKVVDALNRGMNMMGAAEEVGFNYDTILKWLHKNEEFNQRVRDARINAVYPYLDFAEQQLELATSREDIMKAKVRLTGAMWKCEKLLPAFQPVSKTEVKHEGQQFAVIGWEDTPRKADDIVGSRAGGSTLSTLSNDINDLDKNTTTQIN